MNFILQVLTFGFCVWGIVRGSPYAQRWAPRSAASVILFWVSVLGCFFVGVGVIAMVMVMATFDERLDTNPIFAHAWTLARTAIPICSGAAFLLHLLLFAIPTVSRSESPSTRRRRHLKAV